jgi:hypothetical protein
MKVTFFDSGREPKCANFPDGKYIDMSLGAEKTCEVAIPYPAPCCGVMVVECEVCGLRNALTVAGRADDPHTVKMACKTEANQYPRGKFKDDDEGAFRIVIGMQDQTVVIGFGKPVTWIGMSKPEAIEFAEMIIRKAKQ